MKRLLVFFIGVWAQVAQAAPAQDFSGCPRHFAGAAPALVTTQVYYLCFDGFATLYSGQSHTALYSAHHLTRPDIKKARTLPRKDSFRPETRLPRTVRVSLQDYKGAVYDRGHLVPNGDMPDTARQYDSFSLANIVPQVPEHNRGVWRAIESHTRTLTDKVGESYVVTGTVFYNTQKKLKNAIVPTHLYKAVYLPKTNVAAVYFSPNSQENSYEIISLNELKNRTGVSAFPTQNPRFDASDFELDSRLDTPQKPKQNNEVLWLELLRTLWRALGS